MRNFSKEKEFFFALILVAFCFSLFFFVFLHDRLTGDQVGLWTYILKDQYREPFSLWNSRASAGAPQALSPEFSYLDISYFLSITIGNVVLRSNIVDGLHLVLFFIGVYLLTKHITKNNNAALVGAMVATFSCGATIARIGANPYFFGIVTIPYIFYTLVLLLETPTYNHSFFLALSFTYLIISGGLATFVWLIFFIFFYIIGYLVLFFDSKKIMRIIIFLALAMVMFTSFSFFKIWAGFTYLDDTNTRPGPQPYEYFTQGQGIPKEIGSRFISFLIRPDIIDYLNLWIGPVGIGLVLCSVLSYKKRHYLLSILLISIAILVVWDTFMTHLAHQVPYLNRTKDVVKSFFLYSTFIGVVSSFGFLELQKRVKTKWLVTFIVTAVSLQFFFFFILTSAQGMSAQEGKELEKTLAADTFFLDIPKDQLFRVTYQDFSGGLIQIRFSENNLYIGDWIHGNGFSRPFLIFKQAAYTKKTNEMLGILNIKYIYSTTQRNNLPLFKSGKNEYLYENPFFLPRYRLVKHAIFIPKENLVESPVTYAILLQTPVDFNTTVVITEPSLPSDLTKFDLLVLGNYQFTQNEAKELQNFAAQGGLVYPDISGMNRSIETFFSTPKIQFKEITGAKKGFDSLQLQINESGWVVLSETFSIYSGWEATLNGKRIPIHRANGITSAVYIDTPGTILFRYKPQAMYLGGIISAVAIIIGIGLLFITKKIRFK
ncbi:MAG: hypothetical protein AABX51_07565 [Nanoarchaeota archaeon]